MNIVSMIVERILTRTSVIERLGRMLSDVESGEISQEDVILELTRIDQEEANAIARWDGMVAGDD